MEKKINIAELLKDCPKGMELHCTMYDNLVFCEIDSEVQNYPIITQLPNGVQKVFTSDGRYDINQNAKCVIFPKGKTSWEGFHRPFVDGDVVFSGYDLISIYKEQIGGNFGRLHSHVSIGNSSVLEIDKDNWTLDNIRFATEKEKQKLFKAIKDNGYKWNTETKTLEKLIEPKFKVGDRIRSVISLSYYTIVDIEYDQYVIKPDDPEKFPYHIHFSLETNYELVSKFDITTLKPFDKVLVRGNVGQRWTIDFFGFMDNKVCPFVCVGHYVTQCIPYEGNEHLLGTDEDCDEYYKTWK